jgi:S1-C subfamily serine protease
MIEDLGAPDRNPELGSNIIGTAFVADASGYMLTAKHVVRGVDKSHLQLMAPFGRSGRYAMGFVRKGNVQKVYPHPFADIAVLKVPQSSVRERPSVREHSGADVLVGDDVLLMGYAEGTDLAFCDDILGEGSPKSLTPIAFGGSIAALIPDDERPVQLYCYDCTTFPGNSGAPLISSESGQFIGVHLRGYVNHVGYAVPMRVCMEFLDGIIRYESQATTRSKP